MIIRIYFVKLLSSLINQFLFNFVYHVYSISLDYLLSCISRTILTQIKIEFSQCSGRELPISTIICRVVVILWLLYSFHFHCALVLLPAKCLSAHAWYLLV